MLSCPFFFSHYLTFLLSRRAFTKTTPLEVKLIHYICVLALIVSGDFTVPLATLANDLNIKPGVYFSYVT